MNKHPWPLCGCGYTIGWHRGCKKPKPSPDLDGHCHRCGLTFEDPKELTHECPPGFSVEALSVEASVAFMRAIQDEYMPQLSEDVGA